MEKIFSIKRFYSQKVFLCQLNSCIKIKSFRDDVSTKESSKTFLIDLVLTRLTEEKLD